MPNDILGRAPSPYVGAFAADASRLIFNNQDGAGLLIQSLQVGYQQPVQPLFEIGSNNRYYIVGRTQGEMGVSRVYGPPQLTDAILSRLGNVCAQGDRTLRLEMGNASCFTAAGGSTQRGQSVSLIAEACVAKGVTYRTEAQQLMLSEDMQVQFGQLSRA